MSYCIGISIAEMAQHERARLHPPILLNVKEQCERCGLEDQVHLIADAETAEKAASARWLAAKSAADRAWTGKDTDESRALTKAKYVAEAEMDSASSRRRGIEREATRVYARFMGGLASYQAAQIQANEQLMWSGGN